MLKIGTDLDVFLQEDVAKSSSHTKWTKPSLQALFAYGFLSRTDTRIICCEIDGCPCPTTVTKDLRWLRVVTRIHVGAQVTEDPDDLEHQEILQLKDEVDSILTHHSLEHKEAFECIQDLSAHTLEQIDTLQYKQDSCDPWNEYRLALLNNRVLPEEFGMCS